MSSTGSPSTQAPTQSSALSESAAGMVRSMLRRNSSSVTFAPCANSAVARRYGGRKTNVAISHAIANSAFSTEPSVSAATTGTICDPAASARLSAWLRRARPMKPRTSASSGGLVAVGPRAAGAATA